MHPSKARLVFNIGVTGHRNISEYEEKCLSQLCKEILAHISDCINDIYKQYNNLFSEKVPKLNLISSLAEGFDSIAAEASRELGYQLQCPLPYLRDEYIKDFESEKTKSRFTSLLGKASSIYEINFERDGFEKAYLNAGCVMLENTDILLAFWDGSPAKGPGGTGDIIELSEEKNVPIIYINKNMQIECEKETDWKRKIKELIISILVPFEDFPKPDMFPYLYYNEKLGQKNHARIYNYITKLFSPKVSNDKEEQVASKYDNAGKSKISSTIKQYFNPFFYEADELAIFYADQYRSAGVLKALIPLLANVALAIGFYWRWGENSNIINVIGFLSQAVLLYWLVRIVGEKNEKNKWHQKFIDYRVLAECIRYQTYLIPFGVTLREIEIPAYNKNDNLSWINWYLRGIVREIGLPNMSLDKSAADDTICAFKQEALMEQINYHNKSADKMKAIGKRLERIGIILFTTGAIITVVRVFIHFGCQINPNLTWFPDMNHKIIKVPTFFNMLSLLFPAFGAVMFAIGSQVGFERLGQRHSFMHDQLQRIYDEFEIHKGKTFLGSRKWIFNVVELMINEVSDWRMFIKSKGISKR